MKKIVLALIVIIIVILGIFVVKDKVKKVKAEYEISNVEEYKYVKYRNGEKFGIIDRKGNQIVEPIYAKIEIPNPSKDLFLCYMDENGKAKVINSNKETLFIEYDKVEAIKIKNIASTLCYEKSVLKYQKDELYGLIDFSGKEITKNKYNSIENLLGTEGKFQVEINEKYGVINIAGNVLVEAKYDNVKTDDYYDEETEYKEAGFIVSNTTEEGYRYGYINYYGKKILNTEYNELLRIQKKEDIYLIVAKEGKYGLYRQGKQLLKPEYQSISYTDNGAIIIEKNTRYGIANLKGEVKVNPKYVEFDEKGIYLYMQTPNENDVYDIEGNKIDINFNKAIYHTENENYNITTVVNNDVTYYGVEDKQGKSIMECKYKYIEYICNDYFIVENEKEKYGVIDSKGTEQIEINYDLIQKIKNKNIVEVQNADSRNVEFYSSKMRQVVKMKDAKTLEFTNFIEIYNDSKKQFLDNNGKSIEEKSEIVQKELKIELPEKIGDYKKMQNSLEDVYYE